KHPILAAPKLDVIGHANRHRQKMPKRPGMKLNSRNRAIGMPIQMIRNLKMLSQSLPRQVPKLRQNAIERRHIVTLGQKQVVAPRVLQSIRPHLEDFAVEQHQEVSTGKRSANKAAPIRSHPNDVLTHPKRPLRKRLVIHPSQAHSPICRVADASTVRSASKW